MARNEVARTTEKPLNQTQLKTLERIVQGDFEDLRQKLDLEIERRKDRKIAALDNEDYTKRIEAAREAIQEYGEQVRLQVTSHLEELAKTHGVDIFGHRTGRRNAPPVIQVSINATSVDVAGVEQARSQIITAANDLRRTVYHVLDREHRKVTRQILLQGVTPGGATELLDDLPEMDDILTLVEMEADIESSESLKALAIG